MSFKGTNDLVTESDELSQKLIINRINKLYPEHHILAEEDFFKPNNKDQLTWIIDPIDGTTNYAHGFPYFSVSIAITYNKIPIIGAVYNPILKELFFAVKDKGAFLNNTQIFCSKPSNLSNSLLGTGFPYDRNEHPKNNIYNFNKLILKCQGIRRAGSASLDICSVACGRLDGFWELKLHPWDIAAAALIASEAGAKTKSLSANENKKFYAADLNIYCGDIIVCSPIIFNELISELKEQ
jgi:myo-inositol-1(or 4)-monophosphatase